MTTAATRYLSKAVSKSTCSWIMLRSVENHEGAGIHVSSLVSDAEEEEEEEASLNAHLQVAKMVFGFLGSTEIALSRSSKAL